MTGFEPQTSGIGSNCSTNWATPTAFISLATDLFCPVEMLQNFSQFEKVLLKNPFKKLPYPYLRKTLISDPVQGHLELNSDQEECQSWFQNLLNGLLFEPSGWLACLLEPIGRKKRRNIYGLEKVRKSRELDPGNVSLIFILFINGPFSSAFSLFSPLPTTAKGGELNENCQCVEGFNPRSFDVGSDRFTNCATTLPTYLPT